MFRLFKYLHGRWSPQHLVDIVFQGTAIQKCISIWVAPCFCSIGEFFFTRNKSPSVRWSTSIVFSDYRELNETIVKIVDKRWLRGRSIILSLATSDVFTIPSDGSEKNEVKETVNLPFGISSASIDFAIYEGSPNPAFACIRQCDMDFWTNFFKEAGLFIDSVVPSGIWWSHFINDQNDISFSLPSGTFISRNSAGTWLGSVFIPDNVKKEKNVSEFTFTAFTKPDYSWCDAFLLPALEGILLSKNDPSFNLNMNNLAAKRIQLFENKFTQFCRAGMLAFCGIIAVLFITSGVSHYWYTQITKKNPLSSPEKIEEMKNERAHISERVLSLKTFISSKGNLSRVLHDVGCLAGDSLWFSEMKVDFNNGMSTIIIGHTLSESILTQLTNKAEKIKEIKKVRLDYTERVASEQIKNITNGSRAIPLFKFKLILNW